MIGMTSAAVWLRTEAQIFLAAPQPGDYDPDSVKGPEWGKAAPVALLIILLMAIALFFLIKSMGKQLKKVPPTFDPAAQTGPDQEALDSSSTSGPKLTKKSAAPPS